MLKKLLASIASAAMLFAPGIEANARTPWILLDNNGTARQFIGYVETVENQPHDFMFKITVVTSTGTRTTSRYIDCTTGNSWAWFAPSAKWLDLGTYLPDTFGESIYNYVCPGY